VDDSHDYHAQEPDKSNSGRGWVMVHAPRLTPEAIIQAMEAGEFYASSGVRLKDVRRRESEYQIEIEAEEGVTYITQFIGTRRGFDRSNEPVRNAAGEALRVTHRYSRDVGEVFAEVKGPKAAYTLKGDEIYVRAKIISSKPPRNPNRETETEAAWTQPLIPGFAAPGPADGQ
jgi:hypothetical protein